MSDYKEFLGKTLDAAISEACAFYDVPREKLEIDILEDAKSGIFGIVGARKARIRVRRAVPLRERADWMHRSPFDENGAAPAEAVTAPLVVPEVAPEVAPGAEKNQTEKPQAEKRPAPSRRPEPPRKKSAPEKRPEAAPATEAQAPLKDTAPEEAPEEPRRRTRPQSQPQTAPADAEEGRGRPRTRPQNFSSGDRDDDIHDGEVLPKVPLTTLDQTLLAESTRDVVRRLILPIVGEAPLGLEITDERVNVKIDCEDTGLLIGRDGQNLAALQYLTARMVTRRVAALVRVQLDAGDYHSRQDSRLRELALELAERVRMTGKSQSSKPLSAYQRRVIHLTLQDDPQVQTRSSGDGMLKRVIVMRRKD